MKRLVVPLAVAALICIVVYQLYSGGQDAKRELAKEQSIARIQTEYLERIPWLRTNPDAQIYREDVQAFLKWYFKQVDGHRQEFGGSAKFDEYLDELDQRQAGGNKDPQYEAKKQAFKDVLAVFETMKGGNYSPFWTASDKGLRLDLLESRVEVVEGEPTVVLPLVLWGALRQVQEESRGQKKMLTSASFNYAIRLLDEKGRLFGELNAAGDPAGKVDYPERFIKEFPAQVVLGRFELPLLPAEVAKAEITFNVSSTPAYGRPAEAKYEWKLDIPSNWKLRPGETWKGAEVSERSREEINAIAQ